MSTLSERANRADQSFVDLIEAVTSDRAAGVDVTILARREFLLRIYSPATIQQVPTFMHAAWHNETIRYTRDAEKGWVLNGCLGQEQLTRVTDRQEELLRFGVTHMRAYRGKGSVGPVLVNFLSVYFKEARARLLPRREREALQEQLTEKFTEANRLIYTYLGQHTSDLTDVQLIELCHRIGTEVLAPGRSFIHTVTHDFH